MIVDAKANGMFSGVSVQFWNDQKEGYSDHPDSYRKLAKQREGVAKVYLVAGTDLCRRMSNWTHSIAHAIIVTRGPGDPDSSCAGKSSEGDISAFCDTTGKPFVERIKNENQSRILLENAYPQFEGFSSTEIREKKIQNIFVPAAN